MKTISYGKNYTFSEYLKRAAWSFFSPLFFLSPRLLYRWRNFLLKIFGAKIGKNVKIYPSAKIMFPWNLEIGRDSVISWDVKIYNLGKISIGSHTIISQYAHICAGSHDYRTPDFRLLKIPITIGNHVWIAADVFVAPGVFIGDNSVVFARSVVVKSVPENVVVSGHPAEVIKERITEER